VAKAAPEKINFTPRGKTRKRERVYFSNFNGKKWRERGGERGESIQAVFGHGTVEIGKKIVSDPIFSPKRTVKFSSKLTPSSFSYGGFLSIYII
jgi:hypothetical protein